MIILEGPDGTGKTNLSRRLERDLSLPLHERASTSLGGPVPDLWSWACRDVGTWDTQPLSIYDRHPLISEYIYGPIIRGGLPSGFTHPSSKGMLAKLHKRALLIFCLPPLETVRKNASNEEIGQMEGVVQNIDAIYWAYQSLVAGWPGWCVMYDYAKAIGPGSYDSVRRAARLHQASTKR